MLLDTISPGDSTVATRFIASCAWASTCLPKPQNSVATHMLYASTRVEVLRRPVAHPKPPISPTHPYTDQFLKLHYGPARVGGRNVSESHPVQASRVAFGCGG